MNCRSRVNRSQPFLKVLCTRIETNVSELANVLVNINGVIRKSGRIVHLPISLDDHRRILRLCTDGGWFHQHLVEVNLVCRDEFHDNAPPFGTADAILIARGVQHHPTLQYLRVEGYRLQDEGIQ